MRKTIYEKYEKRDRQIDERTDKNNAYCPIPAGRKKAVFSKLSI